MDRLSPIFRASSLTGSAVSFQSQIYQYTNDEVASNFTILTNWSASNELDIVVKDIEVADIVQKADALNEVKYNAKCYSWIASMKESPMNIISIL